MNDSEETLDFDFPESESPYFTEWGESIDIDAIPVDDLTEEPAAKRLKRNVGVLGREQHESEAVSVIQPAWFVCSGTTISPVPQESLHRDGYLARGILERLLHSKDIYPGLFSSPVLQLFGAKFVTGSALLHHTDKLFFLLRQQIFMMEDLQNKRGMWPLSDDSLSCAERMRKDCNTFMAYLHTFICNSLHGTDQADHRHALFQQLALLPTKLKSQLDGLLLFLGRLTDLPSTSYTRPDTLSRTTAVQLSAVGHVFHLYLDLIWNSLQAMYELWDRQGQTSNVTGSDLLMSIRSVTCSVLWDLVSIAAAHYNKVNQSCAVKTSPWPCTCVCELWILLIHFMDNLAASTELQSFWSVVSSIMSDVLHPRELPESQETGFQIYAPPEFSVKDPSGFCWWLLTHLAPLYWYNDQGVFTQRKKGSAPGNWVLAQDLLKSSLQSAREGHEEVQSRSCLKCCIVLSQHWSANNDLILWLWDYFHKRMNDSFHVLGQSLSAIAIVSNSSLQWMEQCYNRCTDLQQSVLEQENSFYLFLRLVALHLTKLLHSGSLQAWRQIKGRFYSKFHKRRMEELNDTGLQHFISLFLTLSCVADLEDVANKMCSFLDLLDFKNAEPSKRTLMLKGMFSLMLIYKEKKSDFGFLVEKVAQIFTTLAREFGEGSSRDKIHQRNTWQLITLYLNSTQDVFEHRNKRNLSEAGLLGDGFQFLFSSCRDSELRHLFTFIQSILTAVRSESGAGNQTDTSDSRAALWGHVFPHIRKLMSDHHLVQTFPVHLADTVAGFLFMALDRHPEGVGVGSSETFIGLFQEFASQDEIPASYCCRLLCHILPCHKALEVLQAENAESAVVRTWFRCLLQLPPASDALSEFTRAVCKLQEMDALIRGQPGFNSRELSSETALQLFIAALGRHHSSLSKFDEIIQFREKALSYLGDVIKHIEPVLSAAGPADLLRLVYHTAGALMKHCYRLIYSKTQPHCLLPRLLDRLILPLPSSKKPVAPAAAQCSKLYLHQFLQGLASLDFKRDDFVRRKIRQVFSCYFHASNQSYQAAAHSCTASPKNPFLVVLKDTLTTDPSPEASDFRQFVVETIRDSHLNLPQPPPKLTPTLYFIEQLFKKTQSQQEIARNTPLLVNSVLGCLIACNTYSPENEPPNIRKPATEILRLMLDACRKNPEMKMREILLPHVRDFLFKNLMQLQGLVFKTFETLALFDAGLVCSLIPAARQAIMQSEQKRGVGADTQLRSAYRSMLKLLGDPGRAELDRLSKESEEANLSQQLLSTLMNS